VIESFRDITGSKRVKEQLEEHKQFLRKTPDSLRDAVLIVDTHTMKIMDCNLAASEMFGFARDIILQNTAEIFYPTQKAFDELMSGIFSAVNEKGSLNVMELQMKRGDGTVFPAEQSIQPLKNEAGDITRLVCLVRDITERKISEQELVQNQKLSSIGQLAAGIAHEINTPISSLVIIRAFFRIPLMTYTVCWRNINNQSGYAKRMRDCQRQFQR